MSCNMRFSVRNYQYDIEIELLKSKPELIDVTVFLTVCPAVVKRLLLAGFVLAAAAVSRRCWPGATTASIILEATPTTGTV